jgi:hypothetical protein
MAQKKGLKVFYACQQAGHFLRWQQPFRSLFPFVGFA